MNDLTPVVEGDITLKEYLSEEIIARLEGINVMLLTQKVYDLNPELFGHYWYPGAMFSDGYPDIKSGYHKHCPEGIIILTTVDEDLNVPVGSYKMVLREALVIHELVHLRQHVEGRLETVEVDNSHPYGMGAVRFDSTIYRGSDLHVSKYRDWPWEAEAYKAQREYMDSKFNRR